jgi:hypothetical protein
MTEPYHLYQNHRAEVLQWNGTDNLQTFKFNTSDPEKRDCLEKNGWLAPDCISYSFNTTGFRDDEFTKEDSILALGCSFTQGMGVDLENTWPRLLSNMMSMRVWNLGIGGSSADTAYRMAEYWLNHLNVKYVTMLVPDIDRFEICWWPGQIKVIRHNDSDPVSDKIFVYKKIYWSNEENGKINRNKNLWAIKQLCTEKQISFRYQFKDRWDNIDYGRDLEHWGRQSNKLIAEKIYNSLKARLL